MIDHSGCSHPATKAGRAACRRARARGEQVADYARPLEVNGVSLHYDFLTWTKELAIALMTKHGLIDKGWQFKWDRAVRRFGQCNWTRRTISLSIVLIPRCTPQEVKETILHEIAHALVGPKRGDHHGYEWKQTAIAIGAKPERCKNTSGIDMPAKFKLVCPNCGAEWNRHRKLKYDISRYYCKKCRVGLEYK